MVPMFWAWAVVEAIAATMRIMMAYLLIRATIEFR